MGKAGLGGVKDDHARRVGFDEQADGVLKEDEKLPSAAVAVEIMTCESGSVETVERWSVFDGSVGL